MHVTRYYGDLNTCTTLCYVGYIRPPHCHTPTLSLLWNHKFVQVETGMGFFPYLQKHQQDADTFSKAMDVNTARHLPSVLKWVTSNALLSSLSGLYPLSMRVHYNKSRSKTTIGTPCELLKNIDVYNIYFWLTKSIEYLSLIRLSRHNRLIETIWLMIHFQDTTGRNWTARLSWTSGGVLVRQWRTSPTLSQTLESASAWTRPTLPEWRPSPVTKKWERHTSWSRPKDRDRCVVRRICAACLTHVSLVCKVQFTY